LDRLSLTIDTMSLPGVPSAPAEGAARLRLRPPAVSQMGTFPSQAAVNEALSAGRLDSDKQETLVVCQPDSVLEKLAVDRRATAGQGDNSNLGAAFVDELLKEWADWAGGCVAS